MTTTDLTATENTIPWPESVDAPPAGWHWGRHVSLGATGTGYYMIRDRDDATLIAIQRPDLGDDDVPTDDEIEAALRATSDEEDEEAEEEDEREDVVVTFETLSSGTVPAGVYSARFLNAPSGADCTHVLVREDGSLGWCDANGEQSEDANGNVSTFAHTNL